MAYAGYIPMRQDVTPGYWVDMSGPNRYLNYPPEGVELANVNSYLVLSKVSEWGQIVNGLRYIAKYKT